MAFVLIGSTWPLWLGKAEFPAIPLIGRLCTVPDWVDRVCLIGLLWGLTLVLLGGLRAKPITCRTLLFGPLRKNVGQVSESSLSASQGSRRKSRLGESCDVESQPGESCDVESQRRESRNCGWLLVLVCGLFLVALDQHRLQPWFYQLLFFSAVFWSCHSQRSQQLLMWIVISIYLYSALGKFDFEFLHTVGQQFWNGATKLIGGQPAPNAETSIAWIAILPMMELLLAMGLAFRPTRMMAGILAMVFHAMLMLLLGPAGLNHSWGVFFWNLQFAGQACMLFVWPQVLSRKATANLAKSAEEQGITSPSMVATQRPMWGDRLATVIALVVIALPSVERAGYWDHWLSWALYAPHSSRAEVWIASTAVEKLPTALQIQISPGMQNPDMHNNALWVRLPLERWSLAETGSPIYPQARFQLGVALALARRIDSEFQIKAVVRGVAARWDGSRWSREYVGSTAINSAAQTLFWINTQPRLGRDITLRN